MSFKILVINPGSTSTKTALFADDKPQWKATVKHSAEELGRFKDVFGQFDLRLRCVLDTVAEHGTDLGSLSAVIGRGGLLKPVESGIYTVTPIMERDLREASMQHAANLGASLARAVAQLAGEGVQACIADPPIADELADKARITGLKELRRIPVFHALNHKAVARHYAAGVGRRYEELNLIIVHMGGGISVGAHLKGRVVDVNNAFNGDGPIAPDRAGSLPAGQLVDLCFSGRHTHAELKKMLSGRGGVIDALGTNSILEVERMAAEGDGDAARMLEAMCYTIAKQIGAMAAVLKGRVDAVLVTGGMANDANITAALEEYCGFIAPFRVYPGEDEMQALAENMLMVLRGEMQPRIYEECLEV